MYRVNPLIYLSCPFAGRGGYASALPFNAYGALGMAREEYSADSASSQFFWLLFDSDLTPAGMHIYIYTDIDTYIYLYIYIPSSSGCSSTPTSHQQVWICSPSTESHR